ncbi:MAG: bifunctional phosphopantothenoylcysteine decarboxylase/phosphopantothenate--cysteine ligase CoaBC [Ginsengibacter sp.]
MLKGKKILLCVTGSIAAYKAVILLRMFIKAEAEVKVIMTNAAKDFVSPLTFSTLSKNNVLSDLFDDDTWADHVSLGRWADLIVIAPASCNTIAKMANGICDNLLVAVYLSATSPVVIAPAMDEDMWHHPTTKNNIEILKLNGDQIVHVNDGELASGLIGEGRMAEPEEIIHLLNKIFSLKSILKGKTALVTAGPTYEAIDPVRFIGNYSSGKMGVAIAKELNERGAKVYLVLGPSSINPPLEINTVRVTTASEMYEVTFKYFDKCDIIVMAAAVADYKPENTAKHKIKKDDDELLTLKMSKTKDILFKAGELKTKNQVLVGFALETENAKDNALKKLLAKNADLIVLNSLKDEGAGFGYNTNKITIFERNGVQHFFEKKLKDEVAADIVNTIINYKND